MAVRVVHHHVERCHVNAKGGSYWTSDGKPLSGDPHGQEALASLACSGFSNLKFSPARAVELPCFVGDNPDLRPCRYDLTVRVIPRSLLGLPDVRAQLEKMECAFPRIGAWHDEQWSRLKSTRPFAGLTLPVSFNQANRTGLGVLQLRTELEPAMFRCALYWSDHTIRPQRGAVLQRSARRELAAKGIRHQAAIAEILDLGAAGAMGPEEPNEGIVIAEKDGQALPIICTQCGRKFDAGQFTSEQLEVIDLWSWLWPMEEERSLLLRTRAMYRRFPETQTFISTNFSPKVRSEAIRKELLTESLTLGDDANRRPADFTRELDDWTNGDEELRQFLERTSCNVDRRLEFVNQEVANWEEKIRNRIVVCTACGKGPVALEERLTS